MIWTWVREDVVLALHDRGLAEFGGPPGVRDRGALSSALARAPNLDAYAEPDASSLAAAYAAGIAKNHPFVDGNKRTAWVAARLFLDRNDVRIAFQKEDAITVMFQLAAGDISEEEFAAWLRERVRPC